MPIEPLSGGLVNASDPSLLKEGELTLTNDCTYRPRDLALWSAPGRTLYGDGLVVTAGASGAMESSTGAFVSPLGLQLCGFDGGDDVLVAQTTTYLATGPAEETGDWTALTLQNATEPLQAVQYANRHFLLDGSNRKVLLKDASLISHGMIAVNTKPTVTLNTSGVGAWPFGDAPIGSIYEYWTTEVYKSGDERVEGTYDGDPANLETVKILSNTDYTIVEHPPQVNPNATHWCLYRSPPRPADAPDQVMFPTGYRVATDIPIGTLTANEGLSTPSSVVVPSAVGSQNQFTNPTNAYAIEGTNFATETVGFGWYDAVGKFWWGVPLELAGFNFSSLYDPIVSYTILVAGKVANSSEPVTIGVWASIGEDVWFNCGSTQMLTTETVSTLTFSTSFDNAFSAAQLMSNQLILRIFAGTDGSMVFASAVSIDGVTVSVVSGATAVELANVFPAVIIEENGVMVGKGRNGQPPLATTGDILQDRLILNDITQPVYIRYSTAGQPHYFAEQYFLPCDSKDKDTVTCIRTLGNIAIVGLKNKLFRVMFLPSETDGVFSRGDALECFSTERGIANARAACTFQLEGQPLMLAAVDSQGIYMTDGYKVYTLTDDIDWENMVDITQLDHCELLCNPSEFKLVFYYNPIPVAGEGGGGG